MSANVYRNRFDRDKNKGVEFQKYFTMFEKRHEKYCLNALFSLLFFSHLIIGSQSLRPNLMALPTTGQKRDLPV